MTFDIIRCTENDLEIIDCAAMACRLQTACRLKTALDRARDAFIEVLDGYTLADLIEKPKALASLLDLPNDVAGSRQRSASSRPRSALRAS